MMKTYTLIIKTCLLLLLMIVAMGCNSDEPVTLNDFDAERNKMVTSKINYPLQLTGFVYFPSYAVKEHRVIAPGEVFKFPSTATLEKVSDHDYILVVTAVGPTETFLVTYDVKITPSGVISFIWPETYEAYVYALDMWFTIDVVITDTITLHEGSIIHGPGINRGTVNYKGKFDGSQFFAASHFTAKQIEFGTNYFYQPPYLDELIQGPIKVGFAIMDLDVVQD